jgi:Arc/MetJ family transcription regulator
LTESRAILAPAVPEGTRNFSARRAVDITERLWRDIHMKRTNLVLNGELLEETLRLSGERTYSRAVDMAMQDFVRRVKAKRILELAGSGLWDGDLPAMRADRPKSKRGRVPR